MLTFKECLEKVKKYYEGKPTSCRDFKDFYLFNFEGTKYTGTVFTSVLKKDGSVGLYDITSDPMAFLESKAVKV